MRKTIIIAAVVLPLAACTTTPYGYGYNDPLSSMFGSVGTLGSAYSPYGYGGGFTQAAASACANHASRYGPVRVISVRQTSSDKVHVLGYVGRSWGFDNFDCSFRSNGRISDFDI